MKWLLIVSTLAQAWTHVGTNIKGWSSSTITFSVNPTNCALSEQALYDVVDRSLAAWNGVPTSSLKLVRNPVPSSTTLAEFNAGTATDVPIILCDTDLTGDGIDADAIPGFMTHLQTNAAGNITYAGVVLNSESGALASIGALSASEISITLAHEIGHALGLGHSSVLEALMYYSIANKPDAVITEDDMDGITVIYPKNDFSGSPLGCNAVHDSAPNIPGILGLLAFFLSLLVLVRFVFSRQQ